MSCCRWSGVEFALALLLIAPIGAGGCKQKPGEPAPTVKAAAATTAASGPVVGGAVDTVRAVDLTVLPEPVRRALSGGGGAGGAGGGVGGGWAGGGGGVFHEGAGLPG